MSTNVNKAFSRDFQKIFPALVSKLEQQKEVLKGLSHEIEME
jgi:mRNA-degrading endonuclease YafQ of YafQ-DinJ toxin-antitoxin module